MRIDSANIDAIKQKADIAEVVSDHIKLGKQGLNYIGLCPFHDDSTPSLTVNTTKGIYKCFACGATGDVIDFLQKSRCLPINMELRCREKIHLTQLKLSTLKDSPCI